jgi:hypothetical protein
MFSFAAGYHPSPDSGQKQATATAIGHAGSGILATRAKNRKRVLDSVFQDGITRSLSALENTFAGKLLVPPFRLLDRMPG